jgi:CRISPR-associated endonuclease Cas1
VIVPKLGVLVLNGYGVHVAVEHGQLALSDGIGADRRAGMLNRATCGLKRLVLLGHSGTISLEALRWLHDVGAAVVQIDADGNVVLVSASQGLDDARLRRAQAIAPWTGMALDLARGLIREKFRGQAEVLTRFAAAEAAREQLQAALHDLEQAESIDQLRLVEAQAAGIYWAQWSSLAVSFARKDAARVPEHWRTFGVRRSPVSGTSRNAANPANAILNYLYAILEAEAAIAVRMVGLDPGMGFLHADQKNRDSLACDLMEAVRPQVDAVVLDLLTTRTFSARDFDKNRLGVCRVLPPLTHLLAETAPRWAKAVAPITERVAQMLAQTDLPSVVLGTGALTTPSQTTPPPSVSTPSTKRRSLSTPLTQANRSAGRAGLRRKPEPAKRTRGVARLTLPATCRGCGGPLPDAERRYCDACLPDYRTEHVAVFTAGGPRALAARRATEGTTGGVAVDDPAHGGAAGGKRGKRVSEQWHEIAAWRAGVANSPNDPTDFVRDLQPKLADLSLSALMAATGLSRRYCWLIKTGQKVPHQRHWAALENLGHAKS